MGYDGILLFFGALFVSGIFLFGLNKRRAAGLVIGLGVLLVLAAYIPGFAPPSRTSLSNACLANLKSIEIAKDRWADDRKAGTNAVPTNADLMDGGRYLSSMPVCPSGGIYNLGKIGEPATCSKTSTEHR